MPDDQTPTISIEMAGRECRFAGDPDDPYFQNLIGFFHDLPPIAPFVQAYIPADAVCLDVGANIGLTAVLLSLLCPRGHVYAFEALPKNAAFLRRNLKENGIENCTVINCAVGAVRGSIDFTDSGAGSHAVTEAHLDRTRRATIRVPVIALDDFVLSEARLPRVNFIKMDIEGFEPPALAGARVLIERDRPPIFMEFNSWCLAFAHGFSPFGFARALFDRFDPASVRDDGSLVPAASGDVNGFLHDNMVVRGGVSDIVLRPGPARRVPSLTEMIEAPELTRMRTRAEAAEAEVRALRASTSWRVTAPIRALRSLRSPKIAGRPPVAEVEPSF